MRLLRGVLGRGWLLAAFAVLVLPGVAWGGSTGFSAPSGMVTGSAATVVAPLSGPPSTLPSAGERSTAPASLIGGPSGSGVFGSLSGSLVSKYSSATADTYERPGGGFETKVFAQPVNFKASSGLWQPIDNDWASASAGSGAVQNGANSWHVTLPGSLDSGDVAVSDAGLSFGFGVAGAASSAVVLDGTHATYRDAFKDASVAYQAESEQVQEAITLSSADAPSSYSFPLDVPTGWTPQLVDGAVQFVDAAGDTSKVAISAPTVTDASDSIGGPLGPVSSSLVQAASGWVLKLSVDQTWLDSPDRVFPVTIDPTLTMNGSQTDCMLISGSLANNNYCSEGFVDVGQSGGYKYHSLLYMGQTPLPTDAEVNTAALSMYFGAGTAMSGVTAYNIIHPWTSAATWNSTGVSSWSYPGGDVGSAQDTETIPAAAGFVNWYLTGVVQQWVSGSSTNLGIELVNDGASTVRGADSYASGTNVPSLVILWSPRVGEPSASPMTSVPMGDGIGLDVNAANGNGEMSFPLFDIPGTGLDFALAAHDSTLGATTSTLGQYAGPHMSFLPGPGLQLFNGAVGGGTGSAQATAIIDGPDGVPRTFAQFTATDYWSPGYDALLYYVVHNGTPLWELIQNSTGEMDIFSATAGATYGLLLYDETRQGEYIQYNWSINGQGTAYLSSVVDTQGRTITPTYGGPNGAVSAWTDSSGRTVSFGYNSSGEVTSITNPAGKQILLGYNASNGEVNQITDPDGNETTIAYDSSVRITSVTRVSNTANGTGPTYSFSYQSISAPCTDTIPAGGTTVDSLPVTSETVFKDPDGNQTTFCDDYDDRTVFAQDAAQDLVTTSYNYIDAPLSRTLTQSNGSTYAVDNTTYEGANGLNTAEPASDTINGVGAPGNSNVTVSSGTASYGNAYPNNFLPSQSTDPQNHSTNYTYDAYGDLLTVQDPWTAPSGPADNTINLAYVSNHPGWLASSSTPDGVSTSYGYDSEGNQTSITPPSGMGQRTFGYDGLSRETCSTDGDGNMTINVYNSVDEVTSTSYLGNVGQTCLTANHVTSSAGEITNTNTYDADGNLTQEVAGGEIATDTYNNLGELTQQLLPTGQTVSYSYDADGNILSFTDGAGTYSYAYNTLGQLTKLTEPNGNVSTFAYNPEGQRTQVNDPNGFSVDYGWDASGRLGALTIYQNGTQTGQYLYNYVSGIEGAGTGTLLNTVPSTVGGTSSSTGYTYDALNRLTAANTTGGGPTYSYTYDGDGNILSEIINGSTLTFGYTGDEQTTINGSTWTYDLDGNITGTTGTSLNYNTLDQPISQGGVTSSYFGGGEDDETGVDGSTLQNTALGLTATTQNGGTSYFTVDPSGNPIGELTPSGDYYFITNPVTGTVMYTIDANGDANTERTNTYSPYGVQTTTGSGPNDLGWNGVFTAANFSIYHFGARQYASAVNRWTQPDPADEGLVSDPVQADPYVFAGDDPINNADPSGKSVGCAGSTASKCEKDVAKSRKGGFGFPTLEQIAKALFSEPGNGVVGSLGHLVVDAANFYQGCKDSTTGGDYDGLGWAGELGNAAACVGGGLIGDAAPTGLPHG